MRSTASVREIQRKLRVLEHAQMTGNVCKTCRYFGIGRASFYRWKATFDKHGLAGLAPKPPIARRHPRQIRPEIEEKVLYLRRTYHLGPIRIVWHLERYHGIRICDASVSRILKRHGLNRLPERVGRRAVHTKRYAKQIPGHHIQVDVKFLAFKRKDGRPIRRFQYTAIDDATRVRALRIYSRHNQKNAMDFIDHIIDRFPFRIHTVRTDRGHEFQAKFHWHVEDKGIHHVYIKPRFPQLNGKVERSHRSDQEEFYQLLTYTDDVDLSRKLAQWEHFYNFGRPHGAFQGKTPYEALREMIK
jgi:transposase InsO family protein